MGWWLPTSHPQISKTRPSDIPPDAPRTNRRTGPECLRDTLHTRYRRRYRVPSWFLVGILGKSLSIDTQPDHPSRYPGRTGSNPGGGWSPPRSRTCPPSASADEYGQPPARAVEKLLSLLATTVGTAARGGPATLSEPDCKELGRKELGDFFELRGGYSLGRKASIPHKKASSLRHAIRE